MAQEGSNLDVICKDFGLRASQAWLRIAHLGHLSHGPSGALWARKCPYSRIKWASRRPLMQIGLRAAQNGSKRVKMAKMALLGSGMTQNAQNGQNGSKPIRF